MARSAAGADSAGHAGELLPLEALDRTGVAITREGTFVRILEVTPPNPVVMSADDRARTAATFGRMLGHLQPGQSLQFYVQARPFDLDEILAWSRREVESSAGPPPTTDGTTGGPGGLSRWRLYGAMEESLRLHADDQAAVQLAAYVIVPYLPRQGAVSDMRRQLTSLGTARKVLTSAPMQRDLGAHRRALRESLAHTDRIRTELESLSLPTRLLNGEQVAELLWARFNPTRADRRRHGPLVETEIVGALDQHAEAREACEAATRLRAAIAQSSLDFGRSKHFVEVDHDLEQTVYVATTAESTFLAALLGATLTRQPFALSMHVHALDRRRERRRAKMTYRRLFAVNRGAEARGRVPDFERYAQEREAEQLLGEMAGHDHAALFRVSIYQSIRERGPEPDATALTEAVDYAVDQIEAAIDCRVSRGEYQQLELWQSTLPLGRDVAWRTRRYATRNAGDLVPLLGTSCGSPDGVPFAFSDPGRTLELLNPYDRAHANQTMLIAGRSGSGKTLCANVIVSRCVAHGARAFVLDRAGHYSVLTQLIEGAREVEIGADHSEFAINPWDVEDQASPPLDKVAFLVSLHQVMMAGEGLTTLERSQLGAAIRAVYRTAADRGVRAREAMLREELLARAAQEGADGAADLSTTLRTLAERLGEFCGEGAYAYLLDRETNIPDDAPVVVFETRHCPATVLGPVIFAIVEYVTRAVQARRADTPGNGLRTDRPLFAGNSIFLIDEGWALVGNPDTGAYANDLARRARHLGLFLIVMSQHLSDFDTDYGIALLRNSTIQVLLEQHPEELPFVRDALRLSQEEADVVGRLRTVKGSHSQMFWVNGTRGCGRAALLLGPTEYWGFTSDPIRDQPIRDQVIADHDGDAWSGIAALARRELAGRGG